METLLQKLREIVAQAEDQLPGNSFLLQRFIFIRVGMWPPRGRWNDGNHFLTQNPRYYYIYATVLLFSFLYFSVVFQIINFFHVTNIDDLASSVFLFATQFVAAFKVQRYIVHYSDVRELLEILNDVEFRPKNEVENEMVRIAIKRIFYAHLAFLLMCTAIIVQWTVVAALSRSLLYNAWYPLDLNKTNRFIFVFGYQLICIIVNVLTNTTLDLLIVGIIMHVAQVQRLAYRLTLMTSNEDMIDCIKVHQKLLGLINKVEDLFGASMFSQLCISVLVFCMTGLVLMNKTFDNHFELLGTSIYLCSMLYQISLYCWAGNDLIHTSTSLSTKGFHCNFADLDQQTKKLLLFFMQRTVPQMAIRAKLGFSFELSLPTLLMVIKSSYSYFAVLQRFSHD